MKYGCRVCVNTHESMCAHSSHYVTRQLLYNARCESYFSQEFFADLVIVRPDFHLIHSRIIFCFSNLAQFILASFFCVTVTRCRVRAVVYYYKLKDV